MKSIWIFVVVFGSALLANEADVLAVKHVCTPQRVCRFDVTIRHHDAGWKHYVNRYEILDPHGAILATRVLWHPHVEEQPFTRSLGGVTIPTGVQKVTVRAHDLVHGFGGKEMTVTLFQ